MNDLETRIQRMLNENVDQLAGPERPAPSFDPGAVTPSARRRPVWGAPLLAAASIVLVVAATIVAITVLSDRSQTRPADPSPVRGAATVEHVVRPVDGNGNPTSGYRVGDLSTSEGYTCTGAAPSATDPGIAACGFFGAELSPCWRAADPKFVLCLTDPQKLLLTRMRLSGTYASAKPPAQPTPLRLILSNGDRCDTPDRGQFGGLVFYPKLDAKYGCASGAEIYAARASDGLDRSGPVWTVRYFTTARDKGSVRTVRDVYVVGTAR